MTLAITKPPMKDRILQAADRLFYGQGIQAVGVDAVAAEAGISKRTLYNHFPSKDMLVAAYLMRRREQAIVADGPPLQQVLGLFDALARWFASRQFRGCAFVNAVSELSGDRHHPAVAVAGAHKAARLAHVESQLRLLGVAAPQALAQQLMVLFEGAVAVSLVRGGDPQIARTARDAACVLLRAAGVEVPAVADGRDSAP
ncbi:MAG: TetR/AcrR family transcriptional regulator [Rhizobacter sp.]|nr:TetR/AcrR family transcriptional regulator [Rhizobacter sp.]